MRCWARYLFILVVSTLGIGQMIAACGQKGDLYLPKSKPDTSQQVPTSTGSDPAPQPPTSEEPAKTESVAPDSETQQPRQN